MKSRRTASFRKAFAALPEAVREQARLAYRRFQESPNHSGLRFKRVHSSDPVYSDCLGFLLTTASIALVGKVQVTVGWRWAFATLALDPALGVAAMLRLRSLP